MSDEIAEFDLCRVGRRAGHDSGDAPVSGGFIETYACAATGWSDDGVVGVAMKINAIAFLVEGDGEVFENPAAEGREFVGEVDDGAGEAVVANGECFGEAADVLGAFARERADGGARAGSRGKRGIEADGVEAQRCVAAGVDEGDKGAVTEADRDERGLARVVEGDGGAGDGREAAG